MENHVSVAANLTLSEQECIRAQVLNCQLLQQLLDLQSTKILHLLLKKLQSFEILNNSFYLRLRLLALLQSLRDVQSVLEVRVLHAIQHVIADVVLTFVAAAFYRRA